MSSTSARPLGGQLWRYGVTGLINTGVGLTIILLLHMAFGIGLVVANAAGYSVGLLIAFVLNRSWTFASTKSIVVSGLKYTVLVGFAFSLCLAVLLTLQSIDIPYLAAQVSGTALYSLVVFLGARYVVFSN